MGATTLLKSPNDKKDYQFLTLTNQLKVLLIHDPKANSAAASMAVNVGHFHDPIKRQGMAHFLEHMLFLGTEKYPQSGEYQRFINQHGGSNNAWTGTEFTNFFFDIDPQYLEAALDRFSQFFIAPLFTSELVDKERQAIESEYQLKLNDDVRRQYQVHKETVNPAHPFAKFSVGNSQTLADTEQSLARDDLLAFYQQQYCASRMTLVISSNHQLDELAPWARHYFGDIIDKKLPKWTIETPLYTKAELGLEIHVQPVKDHKKLFVAFALPCIDHYYKTKPLTYLSHILGNEYPDSLFSVLKQQGLINSLSAGGGVSGSNFKDFNISFGLTDKGLEERDEIVNQLFAYIAQIKQQGLDSWRYREKQAIVEQAYQFQETSRPIDVVSHLSINLHHYQPEHVIYGDYIMAGFDEAELRQLLDYFCPNNMRILVSAAGLATDKEAAWYFTPYAVKKIEPERIAHWQQIGINPLLKLPPPNPFIVLGLNGTQTGPSTEKPIILRDQAGFRVWYKKDNTFNVPKGSLYIAVDSEHAVKSIRHIAMTRLAVELFLDLLTEITYPAEIAGLGYRIYSHQGGFTLHFSGLTAKQYLLVQLVLSTRKFGKVDSDRFEHIKSQLIRSWKNQKQGKPISQLFSQLTSLLQPANPPASLMAKAISDVTVDEMPGFVEQLYKQVHIEVLAHGDWQQQEIETLADFLLKELAPNSTPGAETKRRLVDISRKGSLVREVNCDHNDSAMIVYYQSMHTTPMHVARYTLANHIMSTTFFHELRTRKQLGYVVGSGNLPLNRHPGIIFYIQSPVAGPQHLLRCIDEFIDTFALVLMELTQAQWEISKQGLISQITEKDANLKSRSQRYWASIGNKDWRFDQREQVASALEIMTRADLIRFITQLKSRISDRVIMCSYGSAHDGSDKLTQGNFIWDPGEFKLMAPKFIN
ncbi:insulinase family protein [Motilimonas sp. E26]|nr:insulinase family protein [Motilimonas sp. E26]